MPEWAQLCRVEVSAPGQFATAVDTLVGPGLDFAVAFAERHADVDLLLSRFSPMEPALQTERAAALLAAAGRFDAARDALTRCRVDGRLPDAGRRQRRFVHQLTRFIDSGGELSLIPASRPPSRHAPPTGHPQPGAAWREVRARRDAVKAIGPEAGNRDRAQLRSMLESELARRDVGADPLWIEQELDHLFASREERRQQTVEGLKALGKLGIAAADAIRKRKLPELPDMSLPTWAEPPAAAVYAVPQSPDRSHRWTAVDLDDGTDEWLGHVYAAVPRVVKIDKSPTFDVWLDWGPGEGEAGKLVAVHVGERRVGALDDASAALYRPVMQAATERAELPCVQARLTPRRDGVHYLLEVALPAARTAGTPMPDS